MPGSAAAFAVSLLPSCSGGLQSIRSDDLVSHWFDTTAAAFTYAGPRGRVIGVMHRLKRCILLSCPCPHVRSLPGHVLHLVFPLPRCLGSGPSSSVSALTVTSSSHASRRPDDCTPSWSFRALRRSIRCSDFCKFHLRVTHFTPGFPSWLRCVLELSQLLDASFRIGLSDLVSCRCRPWASLAFEGFSPSVAPGASRLAVSSVSLSRRSSLRSSCAIGFEDVSIGRMR